MNVGVLGGTFDPLHFGHLIIAVEAGSRLGLDRVLFVPAGEQWRKAGLAVSPVEDRVEMVRRGIAGNPYFQLSLVDAERLGPSYTVDTVEILQEELGRGARLYFILGRDSLMDLPSWHEPERLLRVCTLVAVSRPEGGAEDLAAAEVLVPGLRERVVLLEGPQIGISGTDLRRRVAEGRPIRYQVPEAVEAYIGQRGLYLNA